MRNFFKNYWNGELNCWKVHSFSLTFTPKGIMMMSCELLKNSEQTEKWWKFNNTKNTSLSPCSFYTIIYRKFLPTNVFIFLQFFHHFNNCCMFLLFTANTSLLFSLKFSSFFSLSHFFLPEYWTFTIDKGSKIFLEMKMEIYARVRGESRHSTWLCFDFIITLCLACQVLSSWKSFIRDETR